MMGGHGTIEVSLLMGVSPWTTRLLMGGRRTHIRGIEERFPAGNWVPGWWGTTHLHIRRRHVTTPTHGGAPTLTRLIMMVHSVMKGWVHHTFWRGAGSKEGAGGGRGEVDQRDGGGGGKGRDSDR